MRFATLLFLLACRGDRPDTDTDDERVQPLVLDLVDVSRTALPAAYPAEHRRPVAVDWDGDGDLDLIELGPDAIWLRRNEGGSFLPIEVLAAHPDAVALLPLDVGADGRRDLLALGGETPDLLIVQDPASERRTVTFLGSRSRVGVLADVDRDGLPDLIAWGRPAESEEPTLIWAAGTAAGFSPPVPLRGADMGPTAVRALALGDVDGDGALDLVASADGVAPRLFLGDGRGAFLRASPEHLRAPAGTGDHAILADLDGDGAPDLLLAGQGQPRLLVNERGRLVDQTDLALPAIASTVTGLAVSDLDQDGHGDLILARADRPVLLLRADGRGRWYDYSDVVTTAPASRGATGLVVADLDGDGDDDLYLTLDDLRRPRLWHLWPPTPLDDLDGDRVPDETDVCPTVWDPDQGDADFEPFACTGSTGCEAATGCTLRWLGSDAYLRCAAPRTFLAARDHCGSRGADLVVPKTAAQARALVDEGLATGWLGLVRDGEGFVGVDGAPPSYTNWAEGEPNNAGGTEDCVQARGDGQWNDLRCSAELPYTCQAPAPYSVRDPGDACDVCPDILDSDQTDSDGDGRGDACDDA